MVVIDAQGLSTVLRPGSINDICQPDNPATPGPDPMCGDADAMAWAGQSFGHKLPNQNKHGFMYRFPAAPTPATPIPGPRNRLPAAPGCTPEPM